VSGVTATVPLGMFARKSKTKELDAHFDELITVTKQGLAFYSDFFGTAYPFAKYDQLFVPEFNEGAMENAGAVTFTEKYLFVDNVVDAQRTCCVHACACARARAVVCDPALLFAYPLPPSRRHVCVVMSHQQSQTAQVPTVLTRSCTKWPTCGSVTWSP